MIFAQEKYVVSPYHLHLLKPYEVLEFIDFPFAQIDIDQNGNKYFNFYFGVEEELEHRLLKRISYQSIRDFIKNDEDVRKIFETDTSEPIYSCLFNKDGRIEKCFAIPVEDFFSDNSIQNISKINFDWLNLKTKPEYSKYNAKFFAHELTRKISSDNIEKLTATLMDAQVDITPHQVDAALFAFKSPLSHGAILADEVGLGKTIEAGLVIAQHWAERKRKILIIVPANIRNQWSLELQEKFFLPSLILEKKSFDTETRNLNYNPFFQEKNVVICSYQFAKQKDSFIKGVSWDLVIIDEAHRLRNVYKPNNIIANTIKQAVTERKKILLTATPLQNSLLELYGLVSIIDENAFGDLSSFKTKYSRTDDTQPNFDELKKRLEPLCKRTLRKQALEYVQFTKRHAMVERFSPSEDEKKLYRFVTEYLQRDSLYALPASQRQLMTLILRRLLSSSTYAISGTLHGLAKKLETFLTAVQPPDVIDESLGQNFEALDQYKDEWIQDEAPEQKEILPKSQFPIEEIEKVKKEIADLKVYYELADNIKENAKGKHLLIALQRGFQEMERINADKPHFNKKAIIFTESTRTQNYIKDIFEKSEFAGKWVMFNGSNNDPHSRAIYKAWAEKNKNTDKVTGSRSSDMRAALVDYFRDEAEIMIATEAAAEGVNLQFCSLLINYDLPWNPQRIEQRIGRIHRYGQLNDVVIVNFLNVDNEADVHVYDILEKKFKLFEGVFGASDQVLGVIESGVDFEKRISGIYQNCRTPDEINNSFKQLQDELDEQINLNLKDTRKKLLENFDAEVQDRLRTNKGKTDEFLHTYERMLLHTAQYFLKPYAEFDDDQNSFLLKEIPGGLKDISVGPYKIGKNIDDAHIFRIGHPLGHYMIEQCKIMDTPPAELTFDYSGSFPKHVLLSNYVGKSGWMKAELLSIESFEVEDHIVFTGITEDLEPVDAEICHKILQLPAHIKNELPLNYEVMTGKLPAGIEEEQKRIEKESEKRNTVFFDQEVEKLENWAEDLKNSLEIELKQLEKDIKTQRTEWKKITMLEEKIEAQRIIADMERRRKELRQTIYLQQDEYNNQKDLLITKVEAKLKKKIERNELFTIRWTLI